jgi:hypothetical protein
VFPVASSLNKIYCARFKAKGLRDSNAGMAVYETLFQKQKTNVPSILGDLPKINFIETLANCLLLPQY